MLYVFNGTSPCGFISKEKKKKYLLVLVTSFVNFFIIGSVNVLCIFDKRKVLVEPQIGENGTGYHSRIFVVQKHPE